MEEIGFLFDLDGVLVDSEREYTRIWNQIESVYPTGIENFAQKIKGQTLTKILNDNYSDVKVRMNVKELLHRLEHDMTYAYCPNAESFLKLLKERGYKTAIVTSSDEVKMAHLHSDIPTLRGMVNVIIDASMVGRSKPDPEGYLTAARKLGLDIRNCVVFEDSVQGVKAGRASGATVVGVVGTKTREELSPWSDILIENFDELDFGALIKQIKTSSNKKRDKE